MLGLLFCSTFAASVSPEMKAIPDLCAANKLPPPLWSAEEACFANTHEQLQFQCEQGKLLFLYIRITQSYCKNQLAYNSRLYFQFIRIGCSLVGRPWAQRDSQCCIWHSWSWPVVSWFNLDGSMITSWPKFQIQLASLPAWMSCIVV